MNRPAYQLQDRAPALRHTLLRCVVSPAIWLYLLQIGLLYWKLHYLFFDVANLWWQWGTILSNAGAVLVLTSWTFLLRPQIRPYVWFFINLAISLLAFADTLYFRYFHDFISIPVLIEAFQLNQIGGSVLTLMQWHDLLFGIDLFALLIGFAVWCLLRRQSRNFRFFANAAGLERRETAAGKQQEERPITSGLRTMRIRTLWKRSAAAASLFLIGVLPTANQIRVADQTTPALLTSVFSHLAVVNQIGIIGYHVNDLDRFIVDDVFSHTRIPDVRKQQIAAWFQQHGKQQERDADPLFGAAKGKNLIVIQMESVQNWTIGKMVNNQEITPNLNAFLKQSMYFPNYYRQTAQGRTSDAEFLSMNSLYPVDAGSVYFRYVGNQFASMPSILAKNGYQTVASVAFDPTFWNRQAMYQAEGFQKFYGVSDYKIDETFGLGLTDQSFFRQALPKLQQLKSPFFSFLITLSSHGPYDIPDKYQTMNVGDLQGTMVGNYIESVHYTDAALGAFLQNLKQTGLLDNSVVVLYGDHDNGISESDPIYDKFMNLSPNDDLGWYRQMKTPLIIRLPHGQNSGIYTQTAGQLDLAPTLLHLLGIDTSAYPMMGGDVTSGTDQLIVFRDHSFTNGKYFFITKDGTFDHGTAYDLKTGKSVDRSQVKDLYEEANRQLEISDDILRGNLIPYLRKQLSG
ncbi:LTA synthase family protein [Fodinisporobacter ferrooxydans]|uniref:LTA synthase family protein n=1 Tax=Fodinisporobacter ferrooxydans TaxID=2901836 RepID=A0ABY4CK82_9BACL|nr:LTA synthase family protein [Alicyclobacillaceae bacterium MYW30-H2]